MSTAELSRVKLEHEAFIPVPKQQIVAALMARLDDPDERRHFDDFCRLVEGIYHFEYHRTSNELKQDFRLFDTNSGLYERSQLSDEKLRPGGARCLWHLGCFSANAN